MGDDTEVEAFIAQWRDTGGSELANTQSFINGLCRLIGVAAPDGSRTDDAHNDYVFERRVFQDNGDGTSSFGRIDAYRRGAFILEAKQGSDADRAAALRGEDDLDLFGQTASARMKRGTARRGTPGWAKSMVQAKGQAERYAKALPVDHGWPPFLLVTDIGYCIEVYADFTGSGKAYAQFPDRSRYRVMLEDLRDADVRKRLAAIWTDPKSLDPSTQSARVTREVADLLATISRRLEARGHSAEAVSGFLMRLLFTMFAEDTGVLLPQDSFKTLLRGQLGHPEHLHHQLSSLWAAMDKGTFAPALGIPVKRFNGYLFKDTAALPLDRAELLVLIEASEKDWTEVEPAIFGTLLERALNPKERAKLGAHYTPRAYVERLVGPTIIEPLRADWAGVRVAAAELIDQDKPDEARRTIETFHGRLAATRVLDPACGTGNFLYVAMARMKELEGEVLDLLMDLGDTQYVAELTGHTITPENFLGIEINPRAAAIAQLVLWIGYLQWHFRVNGKNSPPPEPILRDIRTIENRDALIDWDARVLERDESGAPVTSWDGETMKIHPVTGKPVPDEAARVEVYRYVKPKAAIWPKADYIIGNPPFIGNKRMRDRLSEGYVDALFRSWNVPQSVDFVMYWWDIAARLLRQGNIRRFGFITTNSLTQTFNRQVLSKHLASSDEIHISFAAADHPWVDETGSAAVRVSMSVAAAGRLPGKVISVVAEGAAPGLEVLQEYTGSVSANLKVGASLLASQKLLSNARLASLGVTLIGGGFVLTKNERDEITNHGAAYGALIKPYMSGRDLTSGDRGNYTIDAFDLTEVDLRINYPLIYQHLYSHVWPQRQTNAREVYRDRWWIYGEPRRDLRRALTFLNRYIITARTAKHRMFAFVDRVVLAESRLVAIALDDAFHLGVLSSTVHSAWSIAWGARQGVGNDLNYNVGECFDPFPFPADVPEPLKARIRAEAEALDALRKRVLAEHPDLTLTKLYNVLEALCAADSGGPALTGKDRDVHDRGLVTLIRQHHDAIDDGVADAYGWGDDHRAGTLDDETILTRLVALNAERAGEEARGLIRYLRPDYQDPGYRAPVSATLDLGEAAVAPVSNVIPWPASLPEQVGAVQAILATAARPMAAQDVARTFKGKRAGTVRPVLDALAGVGLARRLNDGRYAA
ncbi:class I SAM-dependent DNA methyltransferase [Sphingomonas montana]|uniref:class I SAM-dependent DNA methyltransferase n=1 Tax=Sphingomonas montana TaxID=1843236 RepID=UPI00096C27E4|nr:DNA methyltransferase [Sphingomonas montana]